MVGTQLNHPNIVRIFDVYEDNQSVIIVEELVDGGELFQRIVKKVRARGFVGTWCVELPMCD